MSDLPADVQQLRQQLQAALEQATQWQQRYETQAQQRPKATTSAATPNSLAALPPALEPIPDPMRGQIEAEVMAITEVSQLQAELVAARLENYRLAQAWEQEQANHAKTRQNLTNALGDAIETLTHLRGQSGLRPPRTP